MAESVALKTVDVSHRFGERLILDRISLEIDRGQIVSLLGPSGSGKTTLLRIVAGLAEPSLGSVTVLGKPPQRARSAKQIGLVPQSPALLPWRTVGQNARLLTDINRSANATTRPDAVELLTEVGLGDHLHAYPHELSGGMQQRVALVRAFALGAPVLLLDEPFAALDEITRAEMRHLLARLCTIDPRSVLFITHSITEAVFLADRVDVLSPRPARIIESRSIPFERPRRPELEDDPAFFGVVTKLRSVLLEGMKQ